MQRIVFIVVGLMLAGVVAFSALQSGKAPPPEHGGETKDRLSQIELERLVERPIDLIQRGDLARGKRQFEVELSAIKARRGARSLQAADMLAAFGLGLRDHGYEHDSIPYFGRAVEAYRAAAGPESAEVGLALHDYARVLYEDNRAAPAPAAVAAMQESVRIRRAALGIENAETAIAYIFLGELSGLPNNTRGEEASIEAAARKIRYGLALLPACPNADEIDTTVARVRLAELYARNGRAAQTIQTVSAAPASFHNGNIHDLADLLAKAGATEGAEALLARFPDDVASAG